MSKFDELESIRAGGIVGVDLGRRRIVGKGTHRFLILIGSCSQALSLRPDICRDSVAQAAWAISNRRHIAHGQAGISPSSHDGARCSFLPRLFMAVFRATLMISFFPKE